jgi:hypothetical protein
MQGSNVNAMGADGELEDLMRRRRTMLAKNYVRAARYRALALTETDKARANLLDRLAEEAEHGVLCTVRHLRLVHSAEATLAQGAAGA